MKHLILLLFAVCSVSAQTISVGAGVLEQSRVLGLGLALEAGYNQEITRNVGITVNYTHAILQTGDSQLWLTDGTVLKQAPDGTRFHQGSLLANYKFFTNDDKVAIRVNAGAALQQQGELYPTAGLDLIAFPDAKIHPYLSWQPVFRGSFSEGQGWSHSVTLNLAIKL